MNVLGQQTETHTTRSNDIASIGALFTTHETEYCCLTGAVATDQTHMLTRIDLQ
jgi:hypothetical protein